MKARRRRKRIDGRGDLRRMGGGLGSRVRPRTGAPMFTLFFAHWRCRQPTAASPCRRRRGDVLLPSCDLPSPRMSHSLLFVFGLSRLPSGRARCLCALLPLGMCRGRGPVSFRPILRGGKQPPAALKTSSICEGCDNCELWSRGPEKCCCYSTS